MQVKGLA